jgi:hypothetical protein
MQSGKICEEAFASSWILFKGGEDGLLIGMAVLRRRKKIVGPFGWLCLSRKLSVVAAAALKASAEEKLAIGLACPLLCSGTAFEAIYKFLAQKGM